MLYIASDHAGFDLKNRILQILQKNNIEIEDIYPVFDKDDDYPDISEKLAGKIGENSQNYGIATCGTGEGICMGLNRFGFIRAATVDTPHVAEMVKKHNNANVICLPGPYSEKEISDEEILEIVQNFLNTDFEKNTERHTRRVEKLANLGKN